MSKDKTINEMIIDEAVQKYKDGEIKSIGDVESYLDGLLQPLIQKLLDAELDNHLEYSNMNTLRIRKRIILEMVIAKVKRFKQNMEK